MQLSELITECTSGLNLEKIQGKTSLVYLWKVDAQKKCQRQN